MRSGKDMNRTYPQINDCTARDLPVRLQPGAREVKDITEPYREVGRCRVNVPQVSIVAAKHYEGIGLFALIRALRTPNVPRFVPRHRGLVA